MKRIVAVALVALAAWTAWPYWSAYSLFTAVRDGDAAGIDQGVDWPTLRAGLSGDMKTAMMAHLTNEASNSADGSAALGMGFAALLGPAMIDRMVETMVTPQGIARLVNGAVERRPAAGQGSGSRELRTDRIRYAFLTGPTTFRLDVATDPVDGREERVSFLFGFVDGGWKLTRLVLPLEALMAQSKKG